VKGQRSLWMGGYARWHTIAGLGYDMGLRDYRSRVPTRRGPYDPQMARIYRGRYTGRIDGSFVVFLIGMRINKPWKVSEWWPVSRAMPPMLKELYAHPEKGFLGGELFLSVSNRSPALLQYWRSFDHLDRFARDRNDPHLPAWREFNRRAGATGSVGIWHETYLVEPGRYEAIYGNMPRFGLAKVAEHLEASGRLETARRRLGGDDKPGVETTY
jgi:hypothetical protein